MSGKKLMMFGCCVLKSNKTIRVNLGCGKDVLDGWENYDKYPSDSRVKRIDLGVLPLPFDSGVVDEVKLSHIVEHLVYRKEFMLEIYRILKPGGRVTVLLPCFAPSLDHKSWFHTPETMVSVCKDVTKLNYTHDSPRPFNLVMFKYNWGHPRLFIKNLFMLLKCLYHSSCTWVMKK